MIGKIGLLFFMCLSFIGLSQLKTKSITIFKNGTAFIHKSGNVSLEKGTYLWSNDLPQAIYGTFWFATSTGKIKGINSSKEKVVEEIEWSSFFDLLSANKGAKVEIIKADGAKVSGVIQEAKRASYEGTVIIKSSDQYILLKESNIKEVRMFEGMELKTSTETEKPVIRLDFESKSNTTNLEVMYLTGGFSWTPMYKLRLTKANEGILNLKASVVNDGEDIVNSDVDLVVGSPSMFTTTQLSDLLAFENETITVTRFKSNFSNTSKGFYEFDDSEETGGAENTTATSMEDLYLFSLKNITLKKGGRAFYPLLETKVKIEHKYVSSLNTNVSVNNTFYSKYETSQIGGEVFHQIKMWNHSSNPFSSGVILINSMENGKEQALATAKLDYTAIENCAYLTISNAPDIEIKEEEIEIERTNESKVWNKNRYIAVKVQGTITVKSYKSQDVQMEIKKLVYGKLENSDTPWKKTIFVNQYYVNSGNNVLWTFDLQAGKEKKIVYSYIVYIRS